MIATPTTLIALLRTIAHGWTTEALAERTREIHELGRELHTRIGVMGAHLDKVGRSLKGAVEAFNGAVGSIESRVLVTARQFEDIGVTREPLAAGPAGRAGAPARSRRPSCSTRWPNSALTCTNCPTEAPASRADPAPEAAYLVPVSAPTLWEEGRMSGSRVTRLAVLAGAGGARARPGDQPAAHRSSSTSASCWSASAPPWRSTRATSSTSACCRRCSCSA